MESYSSQCQQRAKFLFPTQQRHLRPQLWQSDFFPLAEAPATEERWTRMVGSWLQNISFQTSDGIAMNVNAGFWPIFYQCLLRIGFPADNKTQGGSMAE